MRAQLTKRLLATAEPRERPYEIRDTVMKGLLLRVQPSGHKSWVIEWTRGKRRTLGAFSHLTLEQARAHAAQATAEVIQRGLPSIAKAPIATTPTLDDFLTERYEPWATVELRGAAQYIKCIRYAFADLLDKPLSAIDVETIRAVESRKVVRSLSPNEEARLRTALINRDRWMVEARASGNRWRALRDEPLYPVLPEGCFGDHLTPVVLLAMNTGLRRGELLSLRWSDIDLEASMITVRAERAKNGRQRHVPLNTEALRVLVQWADQRGRAGRLFDIAGVKTAWGALLDAAGIEEFRFHDLRHHFASKLVRASVDLNTVRELLGHADLKMTLRYSHLMPQNLAEAVAKLAD